MFKRVYGFFHEEHEKYPDLSLLPEKFKRLSAPDKHEKILVMMNREEYEILQELFAELERADKKYMFDPMVEAKVGLKTIQCELVELEREIERTEIRSKNMYKEPNQVMTMAYKFIRDICKGVQ